MSLLKASPLHVPEDTCQTLLDLALRHLTLCKAAHIDMVPKHHNWVHMTLRLRFYGNARTWATFLDEPLNLLLANMGARFFVHRGAVWAAQPGGHSSNFQGGVWNLNAVAPWLRWPWRGHRSDGGTNRAPNIFRRQVIGAIHGNAVSSTVCGFCPRSSATPLSRQSSCRRSERTLHSLLLIGGGVAGLVVRR